MNGCITAQEVENIARRTAEKLLEKLSYECMGYKVHEHDALINN